MEIGIIIFILLAVGLYYLPTFICVERKTDNAGSVFVINTLLGWTCIMWLVLLIVAITSRPADARYVAR
jgi:hypothetical protein